MKKYWVISAISLLCDQFSKLWASSRLTQGAINVWPGVFRFRYARNTGAAFSMFMGGNAWLAAITAIMIVVVLWMYFKEKNLSRLSRGGLTFVFAGGAGNLIDRLARGFVVDFIEPVFINFAIFNIADIMVCLGAALVLLGLIIEGVRKNAVDD